MISRYIFKIMYLGSFILSGLILLDTLVLRGSLKLLWIAVANTTSASPFSTDGQSNYICVGVFIIIGLICYLIYRTIVAIDKEEKKVKKEESVEERTED